MARKASAVPYPFVGVDGEGSSVSGRHEYMMLGAGDRLLMTGQPLTWRDCFPFLAALPARRINVAYFFNYDTTMICRDLPQGVLTSLLDREVRELPEGRGHMPVRFAGWEFDWVPSKEFKVRRQAYQGAPKNHWSVINDVGTFFQTSFLKALRTWGIGTDADLAAIESGKSQRGSFEDMTEEVLRYNALEISLLETLMETFRDVCTDVGYIPKRWQGPGNMAAAMFERHGVPRHTELPPIPRGVWRFAQAGYYGGRFEAPGFGWQR